MSNKTSSTSAPVIAVALIAVVVFSILGVLVAVWLWNLLMPSIFGLPSLSWLQMLGLMVLGRLLTATSAG